MLNVRAIPLHLLIHEVEYMEVRKDSRYGTEYAEPIKIEKVLVQYGTRLKRKSVAIGESEEQQIKALLFLDAIHTKPFILLKEKSKILFDGQEFIVDFVDRCYTTKLHHYEVQLV